MEVKEIKIIPPEGYEIDKEKSTFEKIVFKEVKTKVTYEEVAKSLFKSHMVYWIGSSGTTLNAYINNAYLDSNLSKTKEQLQSILALNKLCNVAKYLNGDWLPKKTRYETKWFISILFEDAKSDRYTINIMKHNSVMYSCIYFKERELAQQAIEILGEREIIKALTLNH